MHLKTPLKKVWKNEGQKKNHKKFSFDFFLKKAQNCEKIKLQRRKFVKKVM